MWEKVVGVAREFVGIVGELADAIIGMGLWGIIPLYIVAVCLIIGLVIASLLGLVVGSLTAILGVVALVISSVGYLVFENVSLSLDKPLLAIAIGIALWFVSWVVWSAFMEFCPEDEWEKLPTKIAIGGAIISLVAVVLFGLAWHPSVTLAIILISFNVFYFVIIPLMLAWAWNREKPGWRIALNELVREEYFIFSAIGIALLDVIALLKMLG